MRLSQGIRRRLGLATFAICLLASAPALSAECLDPPGDINGSGVVNVADAQCVNLVVLWTFDGAQGPPPACAAYSPGEADINCDGNLSVGDTVAILRLILDHVLPIEIDEDANGCADACEVPLELQAAAAPPIVFAGTTTAPGIHVRSLNPWASLPTPTGGIFTGNTVRSQLVGPPAP